MKAIVEMPMLGRSGMEQDGLSMTIQGHLTKSGLTERSKMRDSHRTPQKTSLLVGVKKNISEIENRYVLL